MPSTSAFVYRRISSDREGLEVGVGRQLEDCEDLAKRKGFTVAGVFTDNDISASTKSTKPRPEYEEMLRRARTGEVGAILAYSNSRLTRRHREFADLIDLYKTCGVRIVTAVSGEDDLSTADGRMVAWFKAVADAAEAERTAERVQRAMRDLILNGKYKGGVRPFGYLNHDTLHDVEAEWVRHVYREFLAGASIGSIVTALNVAGVETTRGNPWSRVSVRALLLRPRNAALIKHQGKTLGEAPWPALVDVATFDAAVGVLTSRTRPPKVRRGFLTGIIRCGVEGCDGTGNISHVGDRGSSRVVYRCRRSPAHFGRSVHIVDDHVEGIVYRFLSDREALAEYMVPKRQDHADELLALRKRRASIARLIAKGHIPEGEGEREAEALTRRITTLEGANFSPNVAPLVRGMAEAVDVEAEWESMDLDKRRAVVANLFHVTIRPVGRGAQGTVGIEVTRR